MLDVAKWFNLQPFKLNSKREEGAYHHSKSIDMYHKLAELDWEMGGDFFCHSSRCGKNKEEEFKHLLDFIYAAEDKRKMKFFIKTMFYTRKIA